MQNIRQRNRRSGCTPGPFAKQNRGALMSTTPKKPKLTGRLIAAELDSIADSVRRLSLKNQEAAAESQARIAARLDRLAALAASSRGEVRNAS
jgi:hypothetical protein